MKCSKKFGPISRSHLKVKCDKTNCPVNNLVRYHMIILAVIFKAYAFKPAPVRKTVYFRKLCSADIDSFKKDMQSSKALFSMIHYISITLMNWSLHISLVDKHAPKQTKTITVRPTCSWYNEYTKPCTMNLQHT